MRRFVVGALATMCVMCAGSSRVLAQARHEIVRGRVTSEGGVAVRGADVVVIRASNGAVSAVVSDATGAFSTDWPEGDGTYVVTASAAGYQTRSMRVMRTGGDSVLVANLQLVAGAQRLAPVVSRAARPVIDRDPGRVQRRGGRKSTTSHRMPHDDSGRIWPGI